MEFFFFSQSKTSNFMENGAKAIEVQSRDEDTQTEAIIEASKGVFCTAANIVDTLNTTQGVGNKVRVSDDALKSPCYQRLFFLFLTGSTCSDRKSPCH